MPVVIHLIDQNADYATRRTAVSLAGELRDEYSPIGLTIGRGGDLRDTLTAARSLDRYERGAVVHAWGTRPLIAASLAGRTALVYTPPEEPGRWDRFWMKWLCRSGVKVVFSCHAQQKRCGGNFDSRVIHPGVCVQPIEPDFKLRRYLGFSDKDFVLLALGESTRSARHDIALWTTAILHMSDPTYRMLAWGKGPKVDHLKRLAAPLKKKDLLRLEPMLEFEQLLLAADAALVPRGAADFSLAAALCMGAGIPLVEMTRPKAASQRVIKLRHDPELRRTLIQAAAMKTEELFNMDRFIDEHRRLYTKISSTSRSTAEPVGASI